MARAHKQLRMAPVSHHQENTSTLWCYAADKLQVGVPVDVSISLLMGHFQVALNLIMNASLVCIWMKANFHNKYYTRSLAFIMRFKGTCNESFCVLSHEGEVVLVV